MNRLTRTSWYDKRTAELGALLVTDVQLGLSSQEAAERLARVGPNELRKGEAIAPLAILLSQFRSLVIWVLIGAAIVSAALGEFADGVAIIAIVLLNAIIGFFQEYRAERAAAALARLTAPRAKVVRDGQAAVIAASETVPGDVLLLDAGDLVAADARLLEASALRANEAPLTGESQPVEKQAGICAPETALADRTNMVFLGTSVVNGSGRAVVTTTGMNTEVGHIAELLHTATSDETPLQKRLDLVAQRLLWACLGIVLLVFVLGLLRSVALFELFLGAVSLAVAAIPEGLPAVVTVALAAFAYELYADDSVAQARNAAFSALVIAELLRSFGARSAEQPIWRIGLFSNMRLFAIVAASFVLQLLIHHLPVLETFFGTEPISLTQCVAWIILGAIPFLVLEIGKLVRQPQLTPRHLDTGQPRL